MRLTTSALCSRALCLVFCAMMCSRAALPKPAGLLLLPSSPAKPTKGKREGSADAATPTINTISTGTTTATGDFTISVAPSVINADFEEMDAVITVESAGGFTGAISLDCNVTPANVTDDPICVVPYYPLTLDASKTTATGMLAIYTVFPVCYAYTDGGVPFYPHFPFGPPGEIVTGVGLILLIVCYSRSRGPVARRRAGILASMTLVLATLGMCGCAGSKPTFNFQCASGQFGPGTFPGQYTIMVIATSGSIMHTANVTFTVPQQ
jgi:hypothetical protein